MKLGHIRLILLSLAAISFVVSLILPAIRNGGESWPGWVLLLIGWQAFFVAEFRWLANWLFFSGAVAVLAFARERLPVIPILSSLVGLAISASCLFFPIRSAHGNGATGFTHAYATLEIGAYFWIGSFFLLFLASLAPNRYLTETEPNNSFQGTARKRALPEVRR